MKTLSLLFALALGLTLPLHADVTMVQDIQQVGGSKPVTMTFTTKIKDHMARVDVNPNMSMLADLSSGDMTSLMHQQKVAMKVTADMMQKIHEAQGQKTPPKADPLVDTGNKETINGFACEEYNTSIEGTKVRLWVTKDAPEAQKAIAQLQKLSSDLDPVGAAMQNQDVPGFPVRTIIETPTGTLTSTVVTLSMDPVPASEFAVPSDYKAMAPPPGMGGSQP